MYRLLATNLCMDTHGGCQGQKGKFTTPTSRSPTLLLPSSFQDHTSRRRLPRRRRGFSSAPSRALGINSPGEISPSSHPPTHPPTPSRRRRGGGGGEEMLPGVELARRRRVHYHGDGAAAAGAGFGEHLHGHYNYLFHQQHHRQAASAEAEAGAGGEVSPAVAARIRLEEKLRGAAAAPSSSLSRWMDPPLIRALFSLFISVSLLHIEIQSWTHGLVDKRSRSTWLIYFTSPRIWGRGSVLEFDGKKGAKIWLFHQPVSWIQLEAVYYHIGVVPYEQWLFYVYQALLSFSIQLFHRTSDIEYF